jgi:hypothetical protein
MTGVGWYSQQISLNFLNLVKFYICKPKSTGRGSLIKKQTICHSRCFGIRGGYGKSAFKLAVKLSVELGYFFLSLRL